MDPFMMVRRMTAVGRKTVEGTLAAPDQIGALWGEIHELVRRVHRLMNRVEHLARLVEHELDQLDTMVVESRGLLDDGADVAGTAREVADSAGRTPSSRSSGSGRCATSTSLPWSLWRRWHGRPRASCARRTCAA